MAHEAGATRLRELPLFPLHTVLFPGGLLGLKVFEARYLDLVGRCLRSGEPFGVVCLTQGPEVGPQPQRLHAEAVGTLAHIREADSTEAGIVHLRCVGGRRFRLSAAARQQPGGLWSCDAETIDDDPLESVPADFTGCSTALQQVAQNLRERGPLPMVEPLRLDDAAWVANRWCELLPITATARQRLMELDDPIVRLRLVDQFLRGKQVLRD